MAFLIEQGTGRQIDAANPVGIDPAKTYVQSGTGQAIPGSQLISANANPIISPPVNPNVALQTPGTMSGAPAVAPAPLAPARAPTGPALPAISKGSTGSLTDFATALDAATNLAKQKRNALGLGLMMPQQGTLMASDFNSILGNLNKAGDNTTSNLTTRAMTAATPTFKLQQFGNDTYQVQFDPNGQAIAATKMYTGAPQLGELSSGQSVYDKGTGKVVSTAPTTASTTFPTTASAFPTATLHPGSTGIEVSKLQKALGIAQTGTYDDATTAAVLALQTKMGVDNTTGPGLYGPKTMAALGVHTGSAGAKVTWSNTQKNSLIGAGLPAAQIPTLFAAVQQHGLQYVLDNSDLTAAQQTALKVIYGHKANDIGSQIDSLFSPTP